MVKREMLLASIKLLQRQRATTYRDTCVLPRNGLETRKRIGKIRANGNVLFINLLF